MTVAHSCGARQSGHELVGQTLAQLVQLTAHLLMATHLELRQHLCQSMLQVRQRQLVHAANLLSHAVDADLQAMH